MLQKIPVESSMISAVAYDSAKSILYAEFNSGKIYAYEEVEPEIFEELLQSDSKGSYMRHNIIGAYSDYPVKRGRNFSW